MDLHPPLFQGSGWNGRGRGGEKRETGRNRAKGDVRGAKSQLKRLINQPHARRASWPSSANIPAGTPPCRAEFPTRGTQYMSTQRPAMNHCLYAPTKTHRPKGLHVIAWCRQRVRVASFVRANRLAVTGHGLVVRLNKRIVSTRNETIATMKKKKPHPVRVPMLILSASPC